MCLDIGATRRSAFPRFAQGQAADKFWLSASYSRPSSAHCDAILARLRAVIRLRHYSRSTEKTYLHWTRRFPDYRRQCGGDDAPTAEDAKAFLTPLATVEKVSASTQNQAFSAQRPR
ncbi:MAG: phage integrase N-terminal SAM-like domain-containing protein [Planctomycetes bacterium]|nr:phage integrase N-terminal SAM-like domain-containing protein [Planctomycetota bacterium]